jgi:hypothetical protein
MERHCPCYLEIDKLADGRYRATVGTLVEHEEICRTHDLEALVRRANLMAGCRSFDDVVTAFRAMRLLGRKNRINGRTHAPSLPSPSEGEM